MSGDRVSKVLAGPVRIRGIQVGEPLDVFFDPDLRCAIGLEVLCRDGIHRFLPWAVAKSGPDGLSISFSLALLDRPQLDYYREHALTLSVLRRLPLDMDDGPFELEDVVAADGRVVAVVVEQIGGQVSIARDEVVVERHRLRYVNGARHPVSAHVAHEAG